MARTGLVLIIFAVSAPPSWACSVPLFRYALERWAPSQYELIVFHEGPLSALDRERVRALREQSRSANLKVVTADSSKALSPELATIWASERDPGTLPRAILRYPDSGSKTPPLWTGAWAEAAFSTWFDSPARRALYQQLTTGYAGVILLVLSGDGVADDAARAILRRELPRIASRIELPARTDDGPQVLSEIPVRVDFPVVEVARSPAEEGLVRMLLGSEEGLGQVRGPIAFPVFGRGRALCSLYGKTLLDSAELHRALDYLCRACSCQVKELNPGLDLLIVGNWESIFDAERGPAPRDLTDPVGRAQVRQAPADPEPGEVRSAPPPGYTASEITFGRGSDVSGRRWPRYAAWTAVALVLVGGSWAIGRRNRPAAGR